MRLPTPLGPFGGGSRRENGMALQTICVLLAAILNSVTSVALPAKATSGLLLNTNAIAFRSNVTETAMAGAEVYIHRRDKNQFRLAQFIESKTGKPFALMAFPTSFGITAEYDNDLVDMSFDFNLDLAGGRAVTYYSTKVKQSVRLPSKPLPLSDLPVLRDPKPAATEQSSRQGRRSSQKPTEDMSKYMNPPDEPSGTQHALSTIQPTISISLQDPCGRPVNPPSPPHLYCTPVRHSPSEGLNENTSPFRGSPKWLWRATTSTQMQQASADKPGVYTGTCDMTTLAAAAAVHRMCAERLRATGDGFEDLCRPLRAVRDALRDVHYKVSHTYRGEHVTLSGFLRAAEPLFAAYERACEVFGRPDVAPRVVGQLANEECGYPPEIALEVRGGGGWSRMLGSLTATQKVLSAAVTTSNEDPVEVCPLQR